MLKGSTLIMAKTMSCTHLVYAMNVKACCVCNAGKLLAFSGPSNVARVYYGFKSFVPDDYCGYFKQRGVSAVVRLNKPVSYKLLASPPCISPPHPHSQLMYREPNRTPGCLPTFFIVTIQLFDAIHNRC